jgi:hypothetical protein
MAKVLKNGQIIEVPDSDFPPPPPPTADMVKQEASRRILAIAPEYKQRNMLARSAELLRIGEANWTTEQQTEVTQMEAIWDQIKTIRTRSNELEIQNPIPTDYYDNKYWV